MGFVSQPHFGFIVLNRKSEWVQKSRYVAVPRGHVEGQEETALQGSRVGWRAAVLDYNPAGYQECKLTGLLDSKSQGESLASFPWLPSPVPLVLL